MPNVSETRLGIDGKLSVEFSGGTSDVIDLSRAVAGVYDPVTDKVNLNSNSVSVLSTAVPTRTPKAPSSGDWYVQEDQQLHVIAGSPLDFSSYVKTAIPAGSKGYVTASGDNLIENGVVVKFNVATWAPDSGFYWIPASNSEVTAALEHLVRSGYNALRIHGVENLLLSGTDGEWNVNTSILDRFDFVLSEAKRVGLYWIHNPMNWWLGKDMDGATDRFAPSHSDGGYKTRIYTHQNIRDHWLSGLNIIYNRINPYTGLNILTDPATLMIELFNETDINYLATVNNASNKFPVAFLTRDSGATAAAKTWSEWISDTSQLHGYTDIAALNTSWGTAYADFAAAGAAVLPNNCLTGSAPSTNIGIDISMYSTYLDDHLASFYVSVANSLGLKCLLSQYTTAIHSLLAYRGISSQASNSVVNLHAYPVLADAGLDVGSVINKGGTPANIPLWHSTNRNGFASTLWQAGGKPLWFGEYGFPSWAKYRAQFPIWVAAMIQNNAAGVSYFCQGRFWEKDYKLLSNGTTAQRFGRVYPYAGHGDPCAHYNAVMIAILQQGGVMTSQTSKVDYIINPRSFGWYSSGGVITRTAGRNARLHGGLYRPMMYNSLVNRCNIQYDPSITSTDDNYASVNLARSWKQFLGDFTPVKAISGVLISGSYGGVTASATAPILTLSSPLYSNTVTGDKILITNLTGSGGTWPGTTLAQTACTITVIDSQHVQVTSGLNLTGTSGFTSGTYCEAAEHFTSMYNNSGNILTVSTTGTFFGATATTTSPVLTLGANGGSTGTTSLVTGDEFFITNLTGTGGTGGSWPGTGFKNSTLTVTVLDTATNTVQVTISSALPSGLSSVVPTAGTWNEGLNIVEGRFREWGISSRKQCAWINTPKLVAFSHASATTFPVTYQNVTFSALTNDSNIFVASLDGLPLTTSKKILVGMVNDAQNSGMKFSDGSARTTIASGGQYPIQLSDSYSKFTLARTSYGNPKITPLGISGARLSKPSKLVVDATNITVEVQNSVADSIFWLIEI